MPRLEDWKMPRVVRWVLTKYIKRDSYLNQLIRLLKTQNIKVIIGVRRSGKCLIVEFTSSTENRNSKFENNVQMRVILSGQNPHYLREE